MTRRRRASVRGIGLAAIALVGGLALACASDEDRVAQHVAAAERYQEEGDLASALVELRSALQIQPKNAELNMSIARVLAVAGKPVRSAFFFGEAYRLDPTNSEAALMQAPAFYASDLEAARALVEEVLEREPDNWLVHVRLAEVRLLEEDLDGALGSALTAVQLEPESRLAHRTVGAVHRARVRERALAGQRSEPAVHEAALAAFERAAATGREHHDARGNWYDELQIALVYADWPGHARQAQEGIKKAFALAEEKGEAHGRRAVLLDARRLARREDDVAFTRWTLDAMTTSDPGDPHPWSLLADLEEREGGSGEAVWQRALAATPGDVRLHAGYVRALAEDGDHDRALAHLESIPAGLGATPDAGALRVEVLLAAGQRDAALASLAELEAAHPRSPLTRLARARIDLGAGRTEEALRALRSLSGEVERADVLRQLSVAEARSGNTEAAIAAADRAIELQPTRTPVPHRIRISMLAADRDWAGVLRGFREMRRLGLAPGRTVQRLRIQALYETGRPEAGGRLLAEHLAAESPQLGMVLLYHRYEGATDPEGVRRHLEAAAERHPRHPRVAQALVLSDLAIGRGDAALARLDAFNERNGGKAMLGLRAQILWALGRREEAEASALEGFRQQPPARRSVELLVQIMKGQGREAEAFALLDAAAAEGRLNVEGLWQLGRLHLARGELDAARARLEEAHAAAPDRRVVDNDLAYVLAETGADLERAVDLAQRAKSARPSDPAVADTLGYVYLKKGLLEPATFEFRSAIELARVNGREDAEFHYHLGLALRAQGREEEARAAFSEALRIEPGHGAAEQARSAMNAPASPGEG